MGFEIDKLTDELTKLFQRKAYLAVGWENPPVQTRPSYRASHMCICEVCRHTYGRHPFDLDELSYSGEPFLHVLCNGDRVKL